MADPDKMNADAALQDPPGQDFVLRAIHLLGGQIMVGQLLKGTKQRLRYPYELFAMPPQDGGKAQITLIRAGTSMDLTPELGLDILDLEGKILGVSPVGGDLLRLYHKALLRRLYPDDPRVVAERKVTESGLSQVQKGAKL